MSAPGVLRTARHEVTLLADAGAFFEAAFADLAAARRRICVESYIVSSDAMGQKLYVALDAACKRGVQVRLLYDPLGSNRTDPSFFEDLRAAGVTVRSYGHLPSSIGSARDHGRVAVMDDAAYTGGAAWGEQWLPASLGGRGWHDVNCRLVGPVVEDFVRLFEQRFAEAAGNHDVEDYDTGDRHPDLRLVSDTPNRASSLVYGEHERAFAAARRRIWIANAYFYPPAPMVETLARAARSGVDVRVLVPGESDLPVIARAARAEYAEWLASGVRLWEYAATVMHAKYAVVDDDWATVGTFNANATSVGLSNEVNVFFRDRGVVAALAAQHARDLARSRAVVADEVERRPFWRRMGEELCAALFDAANRLWGPR